MRTEQVGKYRQFHQQRRKQRIDAVEQKRQRILGEIAKIVDILKINGVRKAILFGSVLNKKYFHAKSDLDLLVYDLPLSHWLSSLSAIEKIDEISDIEIDLKRAEELPDNFIACIDKHGRHIL